MTKGFYKRFLDYIADYTDRVYAPEEEYGVFHIEFDDTEGSADADVCVKNRYSEDERGCGYYFDKIEDICARVYDKEGNEVEFDKRALKAA